MFDYLEYLQSKIPKATVNSTGQIVATCPFCDKDLKLYVDKKSGNYICFSCEERGRGLVGLIARIEGLSYNNAKDFINNDEGALARESTIAELLERMGRTPEREVASKVDIPLPDGFTPVFDGKRWRHPQYLKGRGISKEWAYKFGLGFVNEGYYGNRIIIPFVCPNGRSFTARDLSGKHKIRYLNPKQAGHSKLVFGWEQCDFSRSLVVVEGAFDAIQMQIHGFQAIGLNGKVFHSPQQDMFWSLPSDMKITVMLDSEEEIAATKVASALSERFSDVFVATLPPGVDPGDSSYLEAMAALAGAYKHTPISGLRAHLNKLKNKG